jgi:hypothetical protein
MIPTARSLRILSIVFEPMYSTFVLFLLKSWHIEKRRVPTLNATYCTRKIR